jgi:hypothetical protein
VPLGGTPNAGISGLGTNDDDSGGEAGTASLGVLLGIAAAGLLVLGVCSFAARRGFSSEKIEDKGENGIYVMDNGAFEMKKNPSRGPHEEEGVVGMDLEDVQQGKASMKVYPIAILERKEVDRAAKVVAQAEKERDMARRKSGRGGAELSPTEKERVRAVFAKIDSDGNGAVGKAELVSGLKDLGHPNPNLKTVEHMMAEVGFEGAEDLTLAGFEMVWASNQGDSAFFGASL